MTPSTYCLIFFTSSLFLIPNPKETGSSETFLISEMKFFSLSKSTCFVPVTPREPIAYMKPSPSDVIFEIRSSEVTLTRGINDILFFFSFFEISCASSKGRSGIIIPLIPDFTHFSIKLSIP